MMMNRLTKVKVLSNFLKNQQNVYNSLLCIYAESKKQVEVKDWLRESGTLETILSLIVDASDVKTKRLAVYCLSACICSNYDSQEAASKMSLFTELTSMLENSDLNHVDQFVCLMLLSTIADNNPCAQVLANVTGCLDTVLYIYGQILADVSERRRDGKNGDIFVRLLVQCIKSLVSSPPNNENQLAVSAHPMFCDLLHKSLTCCDVKDCVLLDQLCEVVGAVYNDCDEENGVVMNQDMFICSLCSKLRCITRSKYDRHPIKLQKSVSSLIKCLQLVLSSQGHLSVSTHSELDKLIHRLIRLASLVSDPQLKQSILFLLVTVTDRRGADTEALSGTDSIRRLYALTKTTDDPIIHCSASYVLLGVTNITEAELRLIRKLAPAALVRMGLSLDEAKQLANSDHVNPKTRKQLFESSDIMDLISSDEESDTQTDERLRPSSGDSGCPGMSGSVRARIPAKKWKQLTPPSKLKSLATSPGWKTRVKRLKSLLKQRTKTRKTAAKSRRFEPSGQENLESSGRCHQYVNGKTHTNVGGGNLRKPLTALVQ